jgi:transcriptional regulator with GAF, ATPase, and Fis domain
MNPRLVAISGPLKGAVLQLTETETTIGRESANTITIADLSLSRKHCVILRDESELKLIDLESLNGTFVNGVPVKERLLEHGDKILLGDSVFLFLVSEEEKPRLSNLIKLNEEELVKGKTVHLRREDALYLDSARIRAVLPEEGRTARDLNVLLKISTTINLARSLESLQQLLLEQIAEVIPAGHGAILILSETTDDFASFFGWDMTLGIHTEVAVSRTIVRQVLRDGEAILSNNIPEDRGLKSVESIIDTRSRSLLVVPMTVLEKPIGVIWLTTTDPLVWFDEDHLQLATAIAAIAGVSVESLRHLEWLRSENERLNQEIILSHNMVGESPRMREIYQRIARVAPSDSTVLIRGESGTGKELAARAIHQNSRRADKPFIAINCAALTETLLESELFGHEKGAFTGAVAQKKGKIEIAQGGTLFLDELGEMSQMLQTKLLRVMQEREFERVGGTRTIKADVRVIAATNRDLEEAIKLGSFRQDLYYRLNVVTLTMPPLRERREDILLLASYFTTRYGERCKRQVRGLTAEARAALLAYDWPGNVRELENAVERAVVLGLDEMIHVEDLPEALMETESIPSDITANYHEAVKDAKKQLIFKAFEQAGGNHTEAAKMLGLHPNYLHRLIRNLNLKALLKK